MDAREELEALRRMAELEAKASGRAASAKPQAPAQRSALDEIKQGVGNLAAGAVRGAGSIGATLLTPLDAAARAVGIENSFIGRTDRRQAMDEGLRSLGAEPDSLLYQTGKLGAEVAGTAGAGGALAKGAEAVRAAPVLVNALRSSGMSAGASTPLRDMAARVAGGAAAGGAAAGLVNPEDAGMGAAIGGALPLALRAARAGVTGGRKFIGGMTGAGDKALETAYQAGKAGGAEAQVFRDNMRGNVPLTDVLDDARANLDAMRASRGAEYRQNMANIKTDKTVLDLQPISQAVQSSMANFTFKGQARNPKVMETLQKVDDVVANWKSLDPAEYHTPEGLDALKQQIGALRENLPFEASSARKAVSGVYNAVKDQIQAQAPTYAKTMKSYSEASELLDEITRSLSLGQKSTADTAMRKLQSIMRNNVNTNYGARLASLEALEQQGGRQLTPALAGQALNNWMPRGIQAAATPSLSAGLAFTGNPGAAAANAALSSPRLMGEAAYAAGRADPIIQALRRQMYYAAPVAAAD